MFGRRRRAAAEAEAAAAWDEFAATQDDDGSGSGRRSVRSWDWSIRGGGPEPTMLVEVSEGDEARLASLVLGTESDGFAREEAGEDRVALVDDHTASRLRQERETGVPERILRGAGIEVRDRRLSVSAVYVEDAEVRETQTRVVVRVAQDPELSVVRWYVHENYDGRTWAEGEGGRSLRVYLGLEEEPADAVGSGWTHGLRGAVEGGVVVRVRPEDADRLADLVQRESLAGFVKNRVFPVRSERGSPALSYVDADGAGDLRRYRAGGGTDPMLYDRIEVQGNHLVLLRSYGDDPGRRATQDALLRKVATSGLEVERWSEGEKYAGRPWAGGRTTRSLREHLGL